MALRDYESRRAPAGPSTWLGQHIIPNPKKGHQPVPSHDMARFYALLPLLATLAALDPTGFQAIASAVGLMAGLHQLR